MKAESEEASAETASRDEPSRALPTDTDPSLRFKDQPLASGPSLLGDLGNPLAETFGSDAPEISTEEAPIERVIDSAASQPPEKALPLDESGPLDLTAPSEDVHPSRRPLGLSIAATLLAVLVGAYAAVWIGGPRADLFHLAAGPRFLLPPSMREGGAEPAEMASTKSPDDAANETDDAQLAEAGPATRPSSPQSTDAVAGQPMANGRFPAADRADGIANQETVDGLFSDPNVQTVHNEVRERQKPALRWPASALRDPQFRPIDELQSLREANETAALEFVEGDLLDRDAVGRKGRAYMKLCEIAERLTLADPSDHRVEATTQRLTAKEVLRQAIAAPANRESLAQIASRWLQYSGRPNQGVLFAGRVADINAVGRDVQYAIELQYEGGNAVANVLQDDLSFRTGATVGVIGIILDDPMGQLVGYEGESTQVVLPLYVFDPDAPPKNSPFNTIMSPNLMLSP